MFKRLGMGLILAHAPFPAGRLRRSITVRRDLRKYLTFTYVIEHFGSSASVLRLALRQLQLNGQIIGIDNGMDFGGQSSPDDSRSMMHHHNARLTPSKTGDCCSAPDHAGR